MTEALLHLPRNVHSPSLRRAVSLRVELGVVRSFLSGPWKALGRFLPAFARRRWLCPLSFEGVLPSGVGWCLEGVLPSGVGWRLRLAAFKEIPLSLGQVLAGVSLGFSWWGFPEFPEGMDLGLLPGSGAISAVIS